MIVRAALAAIALALAAGCEGPSRPDLLCTRLVECGLIEIDLEACIANRTACVEDLSDAQEAAWSAAMDGCFDLDACATFDTCWNAVPTC
jgi:hypothetical protein